MGWRTKAYTPLVLKPLALSFVLKPSRDQKKINAASKKIKKNKTKNHVSPISYL